MKIVQMFTNIFPITLAFEEFIISRIRFNESLLSDLRTNYNQDYSFFRHSDFIYISQDIEIPLNIGEERISLRKGQNIDVESSLIKHLFFRQFIRKFPDVIPTSFYPFRFFSRKHDLIETLLPNDLKSKLGFKRQQEIHFRRLKLDGNLTHCAVYNIDYKWFFDKNCFELDHERFDLIGLDVLHSVPIPNSHKVIANEERLIGKIINTHLKDYDKHALVETNDGQVSIPLDELFLERRKQNIGKYLNHKVPGLSIEKVYDEISRRRPEVKSLKDLKEEIEKLASQFAKYDYANKSGFRFTISSDGNLPNKALKIYKPTFVFDVDDLQKNHNPYLGLSSYGPADKSYFTPKKLSVLVICNSANRGSFSNFVETLKKGIPSGSKYFADGMLGKYQLRDIEFEFAEVTDYRATSYLMAITERLGKGLNPNLVIVETKEEFRKLDTVENPYYQVKSRMLGSGIPVQAIESSTLRNNHNLDAFYNLISLQIYAKLGGIPWELPTTRRHDKEIVVGIGSYLQRTNKYRNNKSEKVVGITTFFSGEGRYLLGSKCREADYERYFDELLDSLKSSIEEISVEHNWREGETILITFHIFKRIKNVEAEVVEKLLYEFPQFKIKYAFVTITDSHPFLLFGANQNTGNPAKEETLLLDDLSCLLQSRNRDDLTSNRHGFPKPLLITIDSGDRSEISYTDLDHITQQVYAFSNLSSSSFKTISKPVTIFYSDKIATWLARLRRIEGWKPEAVNTSLKLKKWFL